LEAEQPKVLPKKLIGLAIPYLLKQWQALTRLLHDGLAQVIGPPLASVTNLQAR
jgi:hypothetical protein